MALPRPLGRHRGSQVTPTPLLLLLLLLPGHVTPVLTGSSTALHHPSPYHDTTNHHRAATIHPVMPRALTATTKLATRSWACGQ